MDNPAKTPLVTVFIAAYNCENYIADAVNSVLEQTYTHFELLIIDDGSTDNTLVVLSTFVDSRIRVLFNEENKGVLYTRQRGLKEAKGKYLAVLDSDDIAYRDRLSLQMEYLALHPDTALLGGQAVFLYPNDEKPFTTTAGGNEIAAHLVFENIFINSTVIINREKALVVGGYILPLAEDYELAVKISCKYQVANLGNVLVKYRVHETNISKSAEMNKYVGVVVKQIHNALGFSFSTDVHVAMVNNDFEKYTTTDFFNLLGLLTKGNNERSVYKAYIFKRLILAKWYQILIAKKSKNIFSLYFFSGFFKWKYASATQIRYILKYTVKNLFK